jgi:hypothetical protein
MPRPRICMECGSRHHERMSIKGRCFPYKSYKGVRILIDMKFVTCVNCGNIVLFNGDCERLDKAIEQSLSRSDAEVFFYESE